MAVMFPFGEPITVVKRVKSGTDPLGNDVFTTTTATISGAFNPGASAELVQGEDLLTVQPSVYLPPGADVAAIDAVQVGGVTYEVDGSPNRWSSPLTGATFPVEVKLKAVSG